MHKFELHDNETYKNTKDNAAICSCAAMHFLVFRLFAVIMDRLMDEVRKEPPWTMLFADDIVICKETREEVKRRLESWRYALERRGMKVSRSKTEYLCINGENDDKTVKMEDTKVPKVK